MSQGVLLTILAGVLWAGIGVIYSLVARWKLDFFAMMGPSAILNAAAAWVVLARPGALRDGMATRTADLAAIMLGSGLLMAAGMTFMQQALRRGHHAATWTIGQSALIFPYLAGVALWREPIVACKTAGVGVILVSLGAFGLAKRRAGDAAPAPRRDYLWLTLAMLTMLGLGTHQALSTWPSHWAGWSDAARLRVPLLATGAAVGYVVAALALRRRPGRAELLLGLVLAAQAVPGQWLLYRAMDHLSPHHMTGLAYPLAVGTCILCFAGYSLLVLKEKLTAFHVVGLALGVAGISLMAW